MVDQRFFPSSGPLALGDLVNGIDCVIPDGAADVQIIGAEELETASHGEIALAANRKYADGLRETSASVVIVGNALKDIVPAGAIGVVAKDPHGAFVTVLERLYPKSERDLALRNLTKGEPVLEDEVALADGVLIAAETEIGRRTVIGANTTIGHGVTIGRDCVIGPNVTIECAHIGDRVTIHAGVRIGCDGFGWLEHGKSNRKVPQLGRVIIQDNVEIGANSTIDRGALGDTAIGEGTKIDNLVQIGHNCKIGRFCLIAATTGLSGSTIVEDGVLMGGGVGTSGHLRIGANSVVHGRAAVTKDWPAGSKLAGAPAQDIKDFWRELAHLRALGKDKKD